MATKTSKKIKKIKLELTLLSIFLWSHFALFLLGWVFALGILAGRGLLPGSISEIGNPLKKFRGKVTQNRDFEYKKPEEEDPAFNFYDNLESKKNEVKKKSLPPKEKETSQAITLSRGEADYSSERC